MYNSNDRSGVDNTHRRKWDRLEYMERAEEKERQKNENPMDTKRRRRWERDPLHQGLIVQRSTLKPRDYKLDLTSRLNRTQVITMNTPLNQQAGFYCSVCDCILRDSQSYLDHINGKWHNRALGMSMRVERSSIEQVRKRFDKNKKMKRRGGLVREEEQDEDREKRLERLEYGTKGEEEGSDEDKKDNLEKKINIVKNEDVNTKEEEGGGLDAAAAALMGFSGFGSARQ